MKEQREYQAQRLRAHWMQVYVGTLVVIAFIAFIVGVLL